MLVIKLGGSLYNTLELQHWLTVLAQYSQQQPIVIVPGGGPFADQVRNAQSAHHVKDPVAHHMALLAMSQFGLLMTGLEPACQPYYYPNEHDDHVSPFSVWLPNEQLLAVNELPHNWGITSDSLALWLSQQLNAEELIVIKRSNRLTQSITDLVDSEILDAEFHALYSLKPITTRVIHFQGFRDFSQYKSKGIVIS